MRERIAPDLLKRSPAPGYRRAGKPGGLDKRRGDQVQGRIDEWRGHVHRREGSSIGAARRPPALPTLTVRAVAAVKELQLGRFHLVVHDIGGPVGFELANTLPDRVASLTIFNTMIDVTMFNPPWSMQPFRYRGLGEMWAKGLNKPTFRFLMRLQGVRDRDAVSRSELDAYLELMKGEDGGRSFLEVMRSTERTSEKEALYRAAVRDQRYPVQVVWAAEDPALKASEYGERARGRRSVPHRADSRQAFPARGPAVGHGRTHRSNGGLRPWLASRIAQLS
jgi:pimeloyl-ACP methyl ester carboxylesterase